MKIIGLHCSSEDLHTGQIALIKHGSRLKNCDLYFSRKPCSACLKMIVNGEYSQGGLGTQLFTCVRTREHVLKCTDSEGVEMRV